MERKPKSAKSSMPSDQDAAPTSSALARAMGSLAEDVSANSLANVVGLNSTPRALADALGLNSVRSTVAEAMKSLSAQTSLREAARIARGLPAEMPRAPTTPPLPVRATKPQKILSATDLGPLVRAARRNMRLSQQAFADLAGVGRRFVSELESGKPTLEFDKVLKVCAAAGVDIAASMRSPS